MMDDKFVNVYTGNIITIKDRILKIIPNNLQLLKEDDPSCLFLVDEFDVSDLEPSWIQASIAFNLAKEEYKSDT